MSRPAANRRSVPVPLSLRDMLLLSDFARANPRRAEELLRRAEAKEPVDA